MRMRLLLPVFIGILGALSAFGQDVPFQASSTLDTILVLDSISSDSDSVADCVADLLLMLSLMTRTVWPNPKGNS